MSTLSFSPTRFYYLLRANVLENYKTMAMMLGGIFLALVFVMYLIQLSNNMGSWDNQHYMTYFIISFLITGLLYSGHAFPAFRNKEKAIHYLTLPASGGEKFAVEIVIRLLSLLIIYPIIFWLAVSFESSLVEKIYERYEYIPFVFQSGFNDFFRNAEPIQKTLFFMGLIGLMITAFTGASSFKRFPFVKSVLIFGVLLGFFIVIAWLLLDVMDLKSYRKDTILFISSEIEMARTVIVGLAIAMTGLLSAAYFKLKEKEV